MPFLMTKYIFSKYRSKTKNNDVFNSKLLYFVQFLEENFGKDEPQPSIEMNSPKNRMSCSNKISELFKNY